MNQCAYFGPLHLQDDVETSEERARAGAGVVPVTGGQGHSISKESSELKETSRQGQQREACCTLVGNLLCLEHMFGVSSGYLSRGIMHGSFREFLGSHALHVGRKLLMV